MKPTLARSRQNRGTVPTISVIVPAYNAEETLERCVGSILAQTHRDLNVILVDDGSTDITGAMCDAYAELDQRVQALHTPNRGLSAARNLGIDVAATNNAELIAFADADDWLEPRMLEELLSALETFDADMAQCGRSVDGFRTFSKFAPEPEIYNKKEALRRVIDGTINAGVWNKLYRAELFRELRFPDGRVFEEIATMHHIVLRCESIATTSYLGYHYVMRRNGITHTRTMANLADVWLAHKERYDYLRSDTHGYLDAKSLNKLAEGIASAVSIIWRWAYGNGPREVTRYSEVLHDMSAFAREELSEIDKSSWPLHLKATLSLAQNGSTASLALAYFVNQVIITMNPRMSGTRR